MDAFDADVLIYAANEGHPLGRRVRPLIPVGIPGNPDIADQQAVFNELWFQPAVQGALWLVGLAGLGRHLVA